eukprot:gene27231-2485_t
MLSSHVEHEGNGFRPLISDAQLQLHGAADHVAMLSPSAEHEGNSFRHLSFDTQLQPHGLADATAMLSLFVAREEGQQAVAGSMAMLPLYVERTQGVQAVLVGHTIGDVTQGSGGLHALAIPVVEGERVAELMQGNVGLHASALQLRVGTPQGPPLVTVGEESGHPSPVELAGGLASTGDQEVGTSDNFQKQGALPGSPLPHEYSICSLLSGELRAPPGSPPPGSHKPGPSSPGASLPHEYSICSLLTGELRAPHGPSPPGSHKPGQSPPGASLPHEYSICSLLTGELRAPHGLSPSGPLTHSSLTPHEPGVPNVRNLFPVSHGLVAAFSVAKSVLEVAAASTGAGELHSSRTRQASLKRFQSLPASTGGGERQRMARAASLQSSRATASVEAKSPSKTRSFPDALKLSYLLPVPEQLTHRVALLGAEAKVLAAQKLGRAGGTVSASGSVDGHSRSTTPGGSGLGLQPPEGGPGLPGSPPSPAHPTACFPSTSSTPQPTVFDPFSAVCMQLVSEAGETPSETSGLSPAIFQTALVHNGGLPQQYAHKPPPSTSAVSSPLTQSFNGGTDPLRQGGALKPPASASSQSGHASDDALRTASLRSGLLDSGVSKAPSSGFRATSLTAAMDLTCTGRGLNRQGSIRSLLLDPTFAKHSSYQAGFARAEYLSRQGSSQSVLLDQFLTGPASLTVAEVVEAVVQNEVRLVDLAIQLAAESMLEDQNIDEGMENDLAQVLCLSHGQSGLTAASVASSVHFSRDLMRSAVGSIDTTAGSFSVVLLAALTIEQCPRRSAENSIENTVAQ